MKSGIYIEWQGLEFSGESIGDRRWIHVPFSEPEPHGEGWTADHSLRIWSRLVPPSEITRMHVVVTTGWLDDVEVWVERLDPAQRTAYVVMKNPTYTGINHSDAPSPHPLLEVTLDPPYSIEWTGTVAWDALTDVQESVAQRDPMTGSALDEPLGENLL